MVLKVCVDLDFLKARDFSHKELQVKPKKIVLAFFGEKFSKSSIRGIFMYSISSYKRVAFDQSFQCSAFIRQCALLWIAEIPTFGIPKIVYFIVWDARFQGFSMRAIDFSHENTPYR
jgi:hypothetical protein